MKPYLQPLVASLLFAAASTPIVRASTFSQFFNNGPTGNTPHQDKNANTYSWQAAYGLTGTFDATNSNTDGFATGVSQGGGHTGTAGSTINGFLFALPNADPGVILLHTTSSATSDVPQNTPVQPANNTAPNSIQWYRDFPQPLAGLTVADITQLSVQTRTQSPSTVMRFAILVDGVWHVSESSWQQTSNAAWEPRVLAMSSSQWHSHAFSTGSLDDDLSDNTLVALPSTGVVSGYGLYADTGTLSGADARIRIDSFQVSTPFVDPYAQWAQGPFANPFTDTGPLIDFDHDGLENLLEFVLGGDPTLNDQPSIRPSIVDAQGDDLIVTFRRSDLSELKAVTVAVQTSAGLDSWPAADEIVIGPVSGSGPNGSFYLVDDSGTIDTVTATIPKIGAGRLFVRIIAR
jgi:hypothetical protein